MGGTSRRPGLLPRMVPPSFSTTRNNNLIAGQLGRQHPGARRGALSQREKVTGRAFDRQIGSTKRGDRYADCRIRTEFALDRHICYATGDRKLSSGESRRKTAGC